MDKASQNMTDRPSLEKHIQTAIQIVITGGVGWVALTAQETSVEVAKMSVEITALKEAVQTLKADTSSQASRDYAILQKQIDSLSERVNRIEDK